MHKIAEAAGILALDTIGINSEGTIYDLPGKTKSEFIFRLSRKPAEITHYRYLVVANDILSLTQNTDLISLGNFYGMKNLLKKKVKKGTGIELTLQEPRKIDSVRLGKWFIELADVHRFCHSFSCQLILSSGAKSSNEMISSKSIEAILKQIDINPENYWKELNEWLNVKMSARVFLDSGNVKETTKA